MNLLLAIMAGCFASFGSIFSKLSAIFETDIEGLIYHYILQILFLGLMVICNVIGLFLFTKALQEINSTVIVTITTTACNYIFSGFVGVVLFEETITTYWLVGTVFIIVGLMIISSEENQSSVKEE